MYYQNNQESIAINIQPMFLCTHWCKNSKYLRNYSKPCKYIHTTHKYVAGLKVMLVTNNEIFFLWKNTV
jgi:hypothetical protein